MFAFKEDEANGKFLTIHNDNSYGAPVTVTHVRGYEQQSVYWVGTSGLRRHILEGALLGKEGDKRIILKWVLSERTELTQDHFHWRNFVSVALIFPFLPTVVSWYRENSTVVFLHYGIINFLWLSANEKFEMPRKHRN
jgi:hypothetical protein